jgi:predicted alpha/beta hydrolase family esterase
VADADGPVLLVAHSLGCILTAWWAAHTRHAAKVRGALLVAPGDVERPDLAAQIHGWAPIARQPLPFPALLVGSRNDPYCSLERAKPWPRPGAPALWITANVGTSMRNLAWAIGPKGHAWLLAQLCSSAARLEHGPERNL